MKLTIFEYQRDRNIVIHIWPTFSHVAEAYQVVHETNRAIWKNVPTRKCVLQLWLITEPSEVQPISYQHSAMLTMLKYLIC